MTFKVGDLVEEIGGTTYGKITHVGYPTEANGQACYAIDGKPGKVYFEGTLKLINPKEDKRAIVVDTPEIDSIIKWMGDKAPTELVNAFDVPNSQLQAKGITRTELILAVGLTYIWQAIPMETIDVHVCNHDR